MRCSFLLLALIILLLIYSFVCSLFFCFLIYTYDVRADEENYIAPGDVRQGGLGDCYFLGALSTLSTDEGLLFDIFPDIPDDLRVEALGGEEGEQQYNHEGVYAVRFFREGKWHNVIVDDYIPCNARGMASFAQPPLSGAEVWAMIAEKAYAKLNGGCVLARARRD